MSASLAVLLFPADKLHIKNICVFFHGTGKVITFVSIIKLTSVGHFKFALLSLRLIKPALTKTQFDRTKIIIALTAHTDTDSVTNFT